MVEPSNEVKSAITNAENISMGIGTNIIVVACEDWANGKAMKFNLS